jgi:flavin-dependent dehydrogenase
MATEKTDVVIVGVGAAGGILAAELAKARGRPMTTRLRRQLVLDLDRVGRLRPVEPMLSDLDHIVESVLDDRRAHPLVGGQKFWFASGYS